MSCVPGLTIPVLGIWLLFSVGGGEEELNEGECVRYSLEVLKLATMNFSDENKLGNGGFGIVYKVND